MRKLALFSLILCSCADEPSFDPSFVAVRYHSGYYVGSYLSIEIEVMNYSQVTMHDVTVYAAIHQHDTLIDSSSAWMGNIGSGVVASQFWDSHRGIVLDLRAPLKFHIYRIECREGTILDPPWTYAYATGSIQFYHDEVTLSSVSGDRPDNGSEAGPNGYKVTRFSRRSCGMESREHSTAKRSPVADENAYLSSSASRVTGIHAGCFLGAATKGRR